MKYGDPPAPAVSVLLPTFRRARGGLFRRAVESILNQTLQEIELIVIDDGSTDGTAEQIAQIMKRDGRVSCLVHARNIGLPAISEYEGFMKARADYIAFAFDDDIFYPGALARLLQHARANPGKLCYGHVVMRVAEKWSSMEQTVSLGADLSGGNIRTWNHIPNSSVLAPRRILEDVGLYDPHIVMSRVCDWDLWKRIGEKCLLEYVATPVGEVTGPATPDSIGKTYVLDRWAAEEWMRTSRNRRLRPEAFGECEIFEPDGTHTQNTQNACRELALNHLRKRPWLASALPEDGLDKQILVANTSTDASTTLYFEFLPDKIRSRVRILEHRSGMDLAELGRAGCLIVVRHLDPFRHLIEAALALDIPCYYFLDDNFTLLQSKKEAALDEDHSVEALKRKLKNFTGVLLSTVELLEFFAKHSIHSNLIPMPPSFANMAPVVEPPPLPGPGSPLTMAFVGGKHRRAGLKRIVLPAIAAMAKKGAPIRLVLIGADEDLAAYADRFKSRNLSIVCEPFEIDWRRSLLKAAAHRPHLLIHAPSDTVNNKFKTLNIAAFAWMLNAVLIAPGHAPFEKLPGAAVLVADPFSQKSWLRALEECCRNAAGWEEMRRINSEFCKTEFSGAAGENALAGILKKSPAVGMAAVESRLRDLYKIRESFAGAALDLSSVSTQELQVNLCELARIRSQRRHSTLFRLFGRKNDLWQDVLPAFDDVKRFVEKQGCHRRGRLLELTYSLHDRDCIEYAVAFSAGVLKTIDAVFSTDGVQKGTIGLELLDVQGAAIFNAVRDLSKVDLHGPVEFDMNGFEIKAPADYRLRLYARSPWPVYAFELVQYKPWGSRRTIAPFLKLNYA